MFRDRVKEVWEILKNADKFVSYLVIFEEKWVVECEMNGWTTQNHVFEGKPLLKLVDKLQNVILVIEKNWEGR